MFQIVLAKIRIMNLLECALGIAFSKLKIVEVIVL